jgi:iron complex outermembrane receptor protein
MNGAAFRYEFRDMQVSSPYLVAGRGILEITNAAKAELFGIDASGAFHMSDRLTLSAGAVWMPRRKFVEYRNSRTGDILSGKTLPRAPEWTATSAIDYRLPLRRTGILSARVEYNYRSDIFFSKENDLLLAQASFGLLNISLRFESTSREWYAFASGRNLTNETYFNQILLQASPGYPSTYEIGFGHRF